jgi:hypothetical protein
LGFDDPAGFADVFDVIALPETNVRVTVGERQN